MNDKVKIKLTLSIGFPTATRVETIEIDREDWEEMGEDVREQFLDDEAQHMINNYADVHVKIVE